MFLDSGYIDRCPFHLPSPRKSVLLSLIIIHFTLNFPMSSMSMRKEIQNVEFYEANISGGDARQLSASKRTSFWHEKRVVASEFTKWTATVTKGELITIMEYRSSFLMSIPQKPRPTRVWAGTLLRTSLMNTNWWFNCCIWFQPFSHLAINNKQKRIRGYFLVLRTRQQI